MPRAIRLASPSVQLDLAPCPLQVPGTRLTRLKHALLILLHLGIAAGASRGKFLHLGHCMELRNFTGPVVHAVHHAHIAGASTYSAQHARGTLQEHKLPWKQQEPASVQAAAGLRTLQQKETYSGGAVKMLQCPWFIWRTTNLAM